MFYKHKNNDLVPFLCNAPDVTMWSTEDEYWILQESYLAKIKQKWLRIILQNLVDEQFIVDAYLYS
jgi:hypothetical protein